MSNHYCLVRWISEDKLSVIQQSCVACQGMPSTGTEYLCKYGTEFYMANVIYVGSNKKCKDKMSDLTHNDQPSSRSRSSSQKSSCFQSYRSSSQSQKSPGFQSYRSLSKKSPASQRSSTQKSPAKTSTLKQSNFVRFGEHYDDLNGPLTQATTKQKAQSKFTKYNGGSTEKSKFQGLFSPHKSKLNRQSSKKDDDEESFKLEDSLLESTLALSSDDLHDSLSLIEEKKKTVRGLAKLNADSKTVFSKNESEIKNFVLTEKLAEREQEIKEAKMKFENLKQKYADLEKRNSSLASNFIEEDKERLIQFSLSTLKNFGQPNHLIEITNFNKENKLIETKVALSNQVPSQLICPSKKASLIQDLQSGSANTKVFKDLMLVFYPDEIDWAKRNADMFFKMCPDLIGAAIFFINEHNPKAACLFNLKLARKALREKCADIRKKIRATKPSDPEFQFLFNGLEDDSDSNDSNSEKEPTSAARSQQHDKQNKENYQLEQTFNETLNFNDESEPINPPLSRKNRIESDGSISSRVHSKKAKF